MSRGRRAIAGYATDVFGQLFLSGTTFLVTPVFLQFTSDATFGFWAVSLGLLTYLGLVDIGLSMSLTHFVAGLGPVTDRSRLDHATSRTFGALAVLGLLLLVVGLVAAFVLPSGLHLPLSDRPQATATFAIAVVAAAGGLPLGVYFALLIGQQRLSVANTIRTTSTLAGTIVTLLLFQAGIGLPSLALGFMVTTLLVGGISAAILWKEGGLPRLGRRQGDPDDWSRLWRFGANFQVARLANTVSMSSDAVVIGLVLGAAAVTPYSLTTKLAILFGAGIVSKAPVALFPAMSQMFAQKDPKLPAVAVGLCRLSMRLGIVGGTFILLANPAFVGLWVGEGNFAGMPLNVVLATSLLLDSVTRGLSVVVQASGDLRHYARYAIAEAAAILLLMAGFVGPLGILGVALAIPVGRSLTTGLLMPRLASRLADVPLAQMVAQGMIQPALLSLPGIACAVGVTYLWPPSSSWSAILAIGAAVVVGNLALFEGVRLLRDRHRPLGQRLRALMSLEAVK